jgi:hypothetical protein
VHIETPAGVVIDVDLDDPMPIVRECWELAHSEAPGLSRGGASGSFGFGADRAERGGLGWGRQIQPRAEEGE